MYTSVEAASDNCGVTSIANTEFVIVEYTSPLLCLCKAEAHCQCVCGVCCVSATM
jgi:hypothetical protein